MSGPRKTSRRTGRVMPSMYFVAPDPKLFVPPFRELRKIRLRRLERKYAILFGR